MLKIFLIFLIAFAYAEIEFEENTGSTCEVIMLDCVAIDEAILSVSNLSAIIKVIKFLPKRSLFASGIEKLFNRLNEKEGLTNSKALLLAFEIKKALDKETSENLRATCEAMKVEFPSNVREIIWSGKVHLVNEGFGEYLYAATNDLAKDKERRSIFTWGDKSFTGNDTSTWEFETDDGETFFIRNKMFNEYLYPSIDAFNHDSQRKIVFTWIPGGKDYPDAHWRIDVVNDNQIILRSAHNKNQIMYAEAFGRDNQRRYVFTWIPYDMFNVFPDSTGIWNVLSA